MDTNKSIFDFTDYKAFLRLRVGEKSARRGQKAAMAAAVGCQPTYISQVLNGGAHLSPEQAVAVNEHLGHTREEAHFFLLLVLKGRAGTQALRRYYADQIQELLDRRLSLTQRLGIQNKLSEEHRAVFYGSWHYMAVYIALTVPELRTKAALRDHFQLPLRRVVEVLEFLVHAGLARQTGERFMAESGLLRIGQDSPHLLKHHSHWRVQSLEALEREDLHDLHYTAVVSLSRTDARKLKDIMLENIKEYLATIRASAEEEVYALTFDFFNLRRQPKE